MTKVKSNVGGFSAFVLDIIDAKDEGETGVFAILDKYASDTAELTKKVEYAKASGTSVRAVLTERFYSEPIGEKLGEEYKQALEIKGGSSSQKSRKEFLRRRITNALKFLERTCDIYAVVKKLEASAFTVNFRKQAKSAYMQAWLKGIDDIDAAPFSVSQLVRLADKELVNLKSYADLQAMASTRKKGAPNKNAGGGNSAVNVANVADIVDGVESAIAGLTFAKDGGLSLSAREKLAHLWAYLDATLTDAQKDAAIREFNSEGDEAEAA